MDIEDEKFERASDLVKLGMEMERILEGISYHERIGIISTLMMKMVEEEHDSPVVVMADLANIFASLITSYRIVSQICEDEEEGEEVDL